MAYTKSTQAPKLLAAAIALGVNNVTSASTETEKLAAITKLQDDTASYTNTETNIFLEALANKVLVSQLFKRMKFKDPLTATFFKEGTSVSAAKEVFDNKLLQSNTYDSSKRYPDKQNKAKVLNTILKTLVKEFLSNTVQTAGVRAAFASDTAFGEWLSNQIALLQESLQVIMFKELTKTFNDGIKNEITLDKTKFDSWDKIFIELTRIANNMKIPSVKYNLGFVNPEDVSNADKVRQNVTSMSDMIVLGSTDVENAVKGKVSPIKYHNSYFKLSKFNKYISLDVPSDELILMDKRGAEGYFRVNEVTSQYWAANMTIEYFLHFWFVFGFIPWANGVRIKFTNPDV